MDLGEEPQRDEGALLRARDGRGTALGHLQVHTAPEVRNEKDRNLTLWALLLGSRNFHIFKVFQVYFAICRPWTTMPQKYFANSTVS